MDVLHNGEVIGVYNDAKDFGRVVSDFYGEDFKDFFIKADEDDRGIYFTMTYKGEDKGVITTK